MIAYIFASKCLHKKMSMETRRDVFQAIADPTRREIINLIAHQSLNLNSIAAKFGISRQAISLHIKILNECGLITIHTRGRDRFCEAKFAKLAEVSLWIDQYSTFWEKRLDALETHLSNREEIEKKHFK